MSNGIKIAIVLGLVGLYGGIRYLQDGPPQPQAPAEHSQAQAPPSQAPQPQGSKNMEVTQLKIEDETVGSGKEAKAGDNVTVHYIGTLTNGKEFDQSYKRGEPFKFQLGAGQVIKGWDQGVAGMKEGGKRKLTIPSSLGYGARGAGADIPPNATLVFQVELLKVG